MRITKLIIALLVCASSTVTLAAWHHSVDKFGVKHSKPYKRGNFYLGAGGGMSSLMVNYSQVSAAAYKPIAYQSTVNNLFPAVQLGYWGCFSSKWMWGAKAFYKYLGASSNYILSAGSNIVMGYGWSHNEDAQIPHEVGGLLTFGASLAHFKPYIGLGILWLPTVKDTLHSNNENTTNTSYLPGFDFQTRKSFVGGLVQLGFLYDLSPKWFVDGVYSFGLTGRSTFSQTISSITLSRRIRVTAQEIMMSINRRFTF